MSYAKVIFKDYKQPCNEFFSKANKRTSAATLLSTAQRENSNLITIIFKDRNRERERERERERASQTDR